MLVTFGNGLFVCDRKGRGVGRAAPGRRLTTVRFGRPGIGEVRVEAKRS